MISNESMSEADCLNDLEAVLQKDLLSNLVGKNPQDIRKYLPSMSEEVYFLYEVVDYLRGSYNDKGIRSWFQREREKLGGKSPLQYLGLRWKPDDEKARRVLELARTLTDAGAT